MLRIWGRINSVNVQKAMWCIGELGLAHERIDAGGRFGGNDEDWYLDMNPNGLVPTIDDDGVVLWESNTIVRYLAAKYGTGTLCPASPERRADAEKWMDWQQTALLPPITTIFWGLVRTPPDERDPGAIEEATRQAGRTLRVLDRHLAGRAYVLGSSFTMADIPVGAMAYRWYALDVAHPDRPHLRAWYGRLCEREAYRRHVMIPLS
ncbi:MAG: glutathione S-transferase family protein [Kiloniellaceae bacterium]